MSAPPVNRAAFASLARRIHSPRPVAIATLHRREQETYRLCQALQTALALIDIDAAYEGWKAVHTTLQETYALHSAACRRHEAAWQTRQIERYEAEQLAAADMEERWADHAAD